jgi:branched-chain amino acid transport system substrate-binding protein
MFNDKHITKGKKVPLMNSNDRKRRTRMRVAVVAAVGFAVAYGGVAGATGDTGATDTTTAEEPAGTEGGAATGEPFRIGFANMDEGQIPQPGMSDGAQAAAAYANEYLNGINGRPIEIVTCSAEMTNESNQACGQQFANDDTLNMAMMGITLNGGPYYEALAAAGLPVVGLAPVTPADYVAPDNVVWYYSGGAGTYIGLAQIAQFLEAKSIAFLQLDSPGGQAGLTDLQNMLEGTDIDLRSVPVAADATDMITPLTAVDAANADLVIVGVPNCLPAAEALQTLGISGAVASIGSCFSVENVVNNADLFEGWYVPMYSRQPLEGAGHNDELDLFLDEYPNYANLPTDEIAVQATTGWGGVLTVQRALSAADPAALDDPDALNTVLHDFTGPVVMGPESVQCPGEEPYPSVCTLDNIFYQAQGGALVEVDI